MLTVINGLLLRIRSGRSGDGHSAGQASDVIVSTPVDSLMFVTVVIEKSCLQLNNRPSVCASNVIVFIFTVSDNDFQL